MKRALLIVAGGKGLRMGGELPKQFIPMAGKPVLMHTLEQFWRWDSQLHVVLVLPESHQPYWRMLCKELGCTIPHTVVNGGDTRFHSVSNGLLFLSECGFGQGEGMALVAVHDGVRPFVATSVMEACFRQAEIHGAVVPVLPMVDSLRQLEGEGSHPVERAHYVAVQTPQVFHFELLCRAYRQPYSEAFTDDASVVESAGHPVTLTTGNRENIKLTTPFDLLVAEALLAQPIEERGYAGS